MGTDRRGQEEAPPEVSGEEGLGGVGRELRTAEKGRWSPLAFSG